MAPEGISDVDQTRRDEERLAELGYKQELHRGWSGFTNFAISFTIISVLAGSFHGLPVRMAERRPDRRLDRMAGPLRLRAHGRLLDGRADLQVPDRGRALLVGARPRRQGLELDDRLVQHRRPDRDRRLGRLRRGAVPQRAARPLRARHLRHQLRRRKAHPRRDLLPLPAHPVPVHAGQHLRRPAAGADQQHLGRLAPARRRGDPRAS